MAKTQRRTSTKVAPKSAISPLMIGLVVGIAVLVVGGLIILGNLGNQPTPVAPVNIDQFPAMGAADAPVTMIDFSDYG